MHTKESHTNNSL
jgi:hypothetical protein